MKFILPFVSLLQERSFGWLMLWMGALGFAFYSFWEMNYYLNGLEYAYRIHHLGTPEDTGLHRLKWIFRITGGFLFLSLYVCGGFFVKVEKDYES